MRILKFPLQPWSAFILASLISFALAAVMMYLGLFGASVLIGTGITLFATGVSECARYYRSTSTLEIEPDIEPFALGHCRISLLVRNRGRVIVRDAKAVLDVLEPEPGKLKQLLSERGEYLVNRDNPRIIGELLPWATPERPIQRQPAGPEQPETRLEYVHITSIAPHQVARLLLLGLEKYAGAIGLKIFSEYGAPGPRYDPTPRPLRAIFTIPSQQDVTFKFRVTIAGEGLREPHTVELTLTNKLLINILERVSEGKVKEAISELDKHMRLLR